MSNATAGLWITDPDAYRAKLDGLLGDRDPIDVKSETADVLAGIVRAHSLEQLRTRPFEGKWTPNEIIGHLMDTEWTYGFRLRLILAEDEPTLLGIDQERWVKEQRHNDRDPEDLVAGFRDLRDQSLTIWKTLTQKQLTRVGRHNERGPESLGQMLRMLAGHDLAHIDQIRRYLDAVKAG